MKTFKAAKAVKMNNTDYSGEEAHETRAMRIEAGIAEMEAYLALAALETLSEWEEPTIRYTAAQSDALRAKARAL
jgi:hypothetical protein